MKLVVDATVVISALIADSTTRELIVTLEPSLLTPAFVHDEIETYTELIVEKSGMTPSQPRFSSTVFQPNGEPNRSRPACEPAARRAVGRGGGFDRRRRPAG